MEASRMSQLYRDPWAKREAWRKHPVFSHRFMFRNLFPGFGLGLGAFLVYWAADTLTHPSNIEKLKEDARKQTGRDH
ncbi:uncharacterized protein PSFLO_03467 [Pseudozyma flocculosa]|uniref:Uncharacterized protein n=1 Tax=Pseudozyma flocculosa TaxID=84751 RepID=A0A5C3F1P9_9BASI|nr:uncharacterized protein PSFLO_03467 [Pseudozyma flocculosa]